jgi:uncharacterized protein
MTVIDSLEFAQTGQSLRGSLPIPGLTRLRDSLVDDQGEVVFVVTGGRDARWRPTLDIGVTGVLHLRCQRCLGALDYPLRLANSLLLVDPGAANTEALGTEDAEWVENSATLDLAQLIEDEILLSLPYAPRHGDGSCRPDPGTTAGDAKVSAFAKLAALKRNND